ncbi:MAG: LysM peptidoglycan-binding domain-containing protein [Lachnospirales bacterium]
MTNDEVTNLPNNVKQVGSISDGNRIYLEDYACTYLEQYAASEGGKEKIALLVGRNLTINDDCVLFINGIIQGKYTIQKNGMIELTEKSWQYIEKQLNLYFKDCQVVGWAYVQPGFEDYISEKLCNFQKNNITKGLQVLYITDPTEKISGFYKWNNNDEVFNNIKGYIIYYEKNDGMHEYMLENKIKEDKPVETPEERLKNDAGAKARKIAVAKVPKKAKHYATVDQSKTINLLSSLSFVMLLVCFIMGATLVQNDDKLNQLEAQLTALESEFQNTKAVFASYSETTTVTTTEAPTEATTAQATAQVEHTKYKVQQGDTLISISKAKYGNTAKVREIRQLNNMENDKIVVGKTILLP